MRQLRAELGTDHGTVRRLADQLGYGVESVRCWVRQADINEGAAARAQHPGPGQDKGVECGRTGGCAGLMRS